MAIKQQFKNRLLQDVTEHSVQMSMLTNKMMCKITKQRTKSNEIMFIIGLIYALSSRHLKLSWENVVFKILNVENVTMHITPLP